MANPPAESHIARRLRFLRVWLTFLVGTAVVDLLDKQCDFREVEHGPAFQIARGAVVLACISSTLELAVWFREQEGKEGERGAKV